MSVAKDDGDGGSVSVVGSQRLRLVVPMLLDVDDDFAMV